MALTVPALKSSTHPPPGKAAIFSLRQDQLDGAADQVDNGQQSGNDPQSEVHDVLLAGLSATV